jgi:hypothetical protein
LIQHQASTLGTVNSKLITRISGKENIQTAISIRLQHMVTTSN